MDCTDAQRWNFSYLVFEYTGSFSCRALQYILQWYMFHYSLSVGSPTGYIVRGNSPARCERGLLQTALSSFEVFATFFGVGPCVAQFQDASSHSTYSLE